MAEFSAQLSQPQAAGANVIAPVRPVSGIPEIVSQAVNIFAGNLVDKKKQQAEEAKNRVIKEYVDTIGGINEAVAQGAMRANEGSMQARARFQQFVSQYPEYISELTNASKALRSEGELGEILEEEQTQQELRRGILKDAAAAGVYVPANASREYEDQVIATFQADRAMQKQVELNIKLSAEQRAASAEERSANEYMLKQNTRMALTQIASNQVPLVNTFTQDLQRRVNSGEDTEVLLAEVNQFFIPIEASIAQIGTAYPEAIGPIRSMFSDMRATMQDVASGKIQGEAIERRLKTQTQAMQLIVLNHADPEFQAAVATGELFKNVPPALLEQWRGIRSIVDLTKDNPNLFNIYNSPEDTKSGMSFLRDRLGKVQTGEIVSPEDIAKLDKAVTNSGKATAAMSPGAMSPDQAVAATKMYASPEFYNQYASTGKMDIDTFMQARRVLSSVYENAIRPQVIQRMQEEAIDGSVGSKLSVTFDGNTVKFSQIGATGSLRPYERRFYSSIEILNNYIRMGAHLEGTNDYKSYWMENRHILLPNYFPSPEHIQKAKEEGYDYIEGMGLDNPKAWMRIE